MNNDWDFMRYSNKEIEEAIKEGTWPPPVMMCGKCKDVLQSKWPGQFIMCKCEASFVDQTPYYSRYGGEVIAYKQDGSQNKHGNRNGGRDAE